MPFEFQIMRYEDYSKVIFNAMASPCEVLFDSTNMAELQEQGRLAEQETRRIEHKFSRYLRGNIIDKINNAKGHRVCVDDETAKLLNFAQQLYRISDGRFDITSGVLRNAWHFDGSSRLPEQEVIDQCLSRVGWEKVSWQDPVFSLPAGMEIDLGGIGKEYAVDRVYGLLGGNYSGAFLVNFGGDIRAKGPRRDGEPWKIGIEKVSAEQRTQHLELFTFALATSGDSQRYLLKDGIRYSHILDPKTGWPVKNAPRSVTAVAPTCIEAGIYSSVASMHGEDAEAFLQDSNITYWCVR
jgi:FAD:protein FMN transferase